MKNEKVKFIIIDVIAITVLILSIGLSSILFFYAYKLLKESKKETIFVDEIIETQVYKEKSDILEENGQETIEIPDIWVDTSSLVNKAVKLDVEYISQYPELPTGCEITSLATVLNYYGYEISKSIKQMSQDKYVIKETTLYSAFTRMEKNGYIESFDMDVTDSGKRRTYYRITEAGRQYYQEKCREWNLTKEVVERFIRQEEENGND